METFLAYSAPALVYAYIFVLNVLLPGRWVTGYVTKTGTNEKLRYHLNGIPVLITTVVTWVLLCHFHILPWDWFYTYRWQGLAGAVVFGLLFSFAIVLPNALVKKSFIADFYLGRLENPQILG